MSQIRLTQVAVLKIGILVREVTQMNQMIQIEFFITQVMQTVETGPCGYTLGFMASREHGWLRLFHGIKVTK